MNYPNAVYLAETETVNAGKKQTLIFLYFMLVIFSLCYFYQVTNYFLNVDNLISSTVVYFVSSFVMIYCFYDSIKIQNSPLSIMMLIGFNFSSLSGALILKTLYLSMLIDNLNVPVTTFTLLSVAQISIVIGHFLCEKFKIYEVSYLIRDSFLKKIDLFYAPSNAQLWLLGFIGVISILLTRSMILAENTQGVSVDSTSKIIAGFSPFSIAPLLIPLISKIYSPDNKQESYTPFVCYFFLLLFVSMFVNTRQVFADGIMTFVLCFFMLMMVGIIKISKKDISIFIPIAIFSIFALLILSRVATAMLVARDLRADVGGIELLLSSIDFFMDGSKLENYSKFVNSITQEDYSEKYIGNSLFSRVVITKFHDNMFFFTGLLNDSSVNEILYNLYVKIVSILPTPLLQLFGQNFSKKDFMYSGGDLIFYLTNGYGLGGYKTGSMIAEGYAILGWMYPVVLVFISMCIFVFFESFYERKNKIMIFSPIILFQVWFLAGGAGGVAFSSESIASVITNILRSVPQIIIIYFVVIKFSSIFINKYEHVK